MSDFDETMNSIGTTADGGDFPPMLFGATKDGGQEGGGSGNDHIDPWG